MASIKVTTAKLDEKIRKLRELEKICKSFWIDGKKLDYDRLDRVVDYGIDHDPSYTLGCAISHICKTIEQIKDFKKAVFASKGCIVEVKSNPRISVLDQIGYRPAFVKIVKVDQPTILKVDGGTIYDYDMYEIAFHYIDELAELLLDSARAGVPKFAYSA